MPLIKGSLFYSYQPTTCGHDNPTRFRRFSLSEFTHFYLVVARFYQSQIMLLSYTLTDEVRFISCLYSKYVITQ